MTTKQRSFFHQFQSSGTFSKQAHVHIPNGLFEEEHGREGFFGRVSHLYHENQPTGWSDIIGELKPRALPPSFATLTPNQFEKVLFNSDVTFSLARFTESPLTFFRNADHDELLFVHNGQGRIETSYGHVPFARGDYIILPRGTTYQYFFDFDNTNTTCDLLKFEGAREFEQPERGLLGPNALYDQTALFNPTAAKGTFVSSSHSYTLEIKRCGEITRAIYPYNPLDVVGWKGSVYPTRLSIYDICPVMSHRYHMPPSAHTTFINNNFVICSFVARPLEDEKHGVLKVPFYHSNIDYDEVLFYHDGDFFSRDNIKQGAITFHPQGIHHGPHPKAMEKGQTRRETDEFAVMLDTRHPLKPSTFFSEHENKNYYQSWMKKND